MRWRLWKKKKRGKDAYIVIVVGSFLPIKWNKRKHSRLLKLENNKNSIQKIICEKWTAFERCTRDISCIVKIFLCCLERALTVVKGNVYQQFISIFSFFKQSRGSKIFSFFYDNGQFPSLKILRMCMSRLFNDKFKERIALKIIWDGICVKIYCTWCLDIFSWRVKLSNKNI